MLITENKIYFVYWQHVVSSCFLLLCTDDFFAIKNKNIMPAWEGRGKYVVMHGDFKRVLCALVGVGFVFEWGD